MTALAKREKPVRSRSHLDFIRQLPCVACMVEGRETYCVDAAHVSYAFPGWSSRGKAEKVSDERTVPACRTHHDEQHGMSERAWWARLGINPVRLCDQLANNSGNVPAGVALIHEFAVGARGIGRLAESGGPITRRPAGPVPVTITAHLASIPRDEFGNQAVLIPRENGSRAQDCEVVWVAPTTITSEGA
jgi:hypothetical protein